jgi:hypothetical protein
MPEFGWDQVPEDPSGYITVDPRVLAAIRELLDGRMQPVLRLVLTVVRVDPTSGNVVVNAQLVRDLDERGDAGT